MSKIERLSKRVAVIDATGCTGCMVCMEFCEFDAIIKVPNPFADDPMVSSICQVDLLQCTGCAWCAKPCPWDVIQMFNRELVPEEAVLEDEEIAERGVLLTAGNLSGE